MTEHRPPYQARAEQQNEQYRSLLSDAKDILKAALDTVDTVALEDLAAIGERANQLWHDVNNQDTCGCSDPGCPCDGQKRGGPPR